MNPILITGGIRNLKNRSFGKNSKTGEKSAENFRPRISPEKTFSSSSKRRTFPEEKPLFSTERFISSKEKTSRRKSKIPEREIAKALLKWFKKTPPFLNKSGRFLFWLFRKKFRKRVSQKFRGILRFRKSVSRRADFNKKQTGGKIHVVFPVIKKNRSA